jgi:hypothetical protein
MGALSECARTVFWYLAWRWYLWSETCRRIFNIDRYVYCCVIDWNILLYYCNTQRDGSYKKKRMFILYCTHSLLTIANTLTPSMPKPQYLTQHAQISSCTMIYVTTTAFYITIVTAILLMTFGRCREWRNLTTNFTFTCSVTFSDRQTDRQTDSIGST